jgi:Amt family ammonium transporter
VHCRYSSSASQTPDAGLFMPGTEGRLFATQVVAILIEIPWVVITSGVMFMILKVAGILRVPLDQETAGLDESKHGGSAYPVEHTATA